MRVNTRQLKKAHHTLMAQYIHLLNEVPKLPFFVPTGTVRAPNSRLRNELAKAIKNLGDIFSLRYLVRLFTESHIKGKFVELSVAYSYLAQQHPTDKALTSWLKETSGDCEKLAATLTSWQSVRGLITAWLPLGIGITTAWLRLDSIYSVVNMIDIDTIDFITLGLVIFPLVYPAIFVGTSFQKKRELFMPGFDGQEKPIDPNARIENSIYYLEDQVFNLIGRRKVHEIPADSLGQAMAGLGFVALELSAAFLMESLPMKIFFLLAAGMFLAVTFYFFRQGLRRKWT